MDNSTTIVPFRWDVSRPHELGVMMNAEPAPAYPAFAEDLRACCAAVLGAAGDADLVFVGRSPESLPPSTRSAGTRTVHHRVVAARRAAARSDPEPGGRTAVRPQVIS
jgi:hypothetical protein